MLKKIKLITLLVGMTISAKAETNILIEAESFKQQGGWVIDQQSMDQMGSPYVLAHGLGNPVSDAKTIVNFPKNGL